MFVNDVLGLCRSNFFTGDVFGTQIPNVIGGINQTPYGFNHLAGQTAYHPLYGYLVNRIPQNFLHQGFVPQTLGQGFGTANTFGTQCLPLFGSQFTSPVLAQGGIGNVGFGYNPYTVGANWNWTTPLGFGSQICR
jgi:hypothetical protein